MGKVQSKYVAVCGGFSECEMAKTIQETSLFSDVVVSIYQQDLTQCQLVNLERSSKVRVRSCHHVRKQEHNSVTR